jgi:hypothetical protein
MPLKPFHAPHKFPSFFQAKLPSYVDIVRLRNIDLIKVAATILSLFFSKSLNEILGLLVEIQSHLYVSFSLIHH